MCLGLPLQVRSIEGSHALCEGQGITRRVSLALLDPPPVGTWVLVHRDVAHKTLSAEDAHRTAQALEALDRALAGESVDHLFADLVGREPTLPPHLRPGAED